MADPGFAPPSGAARPPPLPPATGGKQAEAESRRRGARPVLWAALYVVASLIWLLWGDPLATAWLGAALVPPVPQWLTHTLFVAASGAFFYWLLNLHARTLQRAAQAQDIRLVECIEQITDAVLGRTGRDATSRSTRPARARSGAPWPSAWAGTIPNCFPPPSPAS